MRRLAILNQLREDLAEVLYELVALGNVRNSDKKKAKANALHAELSTIRAMIRHLEREDANA